MAGIALEIATASVVAIREQVNYTNNNPLKAPVSEVSAILRVVVNSTNVDVRNPISLEHTWLNLSGTPFSLAAKEARWFEHLDNYATHHVAYYGIAVRFEYNQLPSSEWNDINNTNDLYDVMFPSITVTDAMSKITGLETYVEFLPRNTGVVKGSVRIFINGFRKDINLSTNSVGKQFYEWNPDWTGLFLLTTNAMPR